MILRKATLSDLDSIMKIEKASFIPQIQEEREVFKQRILRCPELFLVFEDQKSLNLSNGPVGYLCAETMQKLPKAPQDLQLGHLPALSGASAVPYIYISSFALLPEFRGGGNGRKMWNESMEYFKQEFSPSALLLLVNELWCGAKHIYSESGFETIRIFEDFFPCEDGSFSNGILMQNLLE